MMPHLEMTAAVASLCPLAVEKADPKSSAQAPRCHLYRQIANPHLCFPLWSCLHRQRLCHRRQQRRPQRPQQPLGSLGEATQAGAPKGRCVLARRQQRVGTPKKTWPNAKGPRCRGRPPSSLSRHHLDSTVQRLLQLHGSPRRHSGVAPNHPTEWGPRQWRPLPLPRLPRSNANLRHARRQLEEETAAKGFQAFSVATVVAPGSLR